MKKSDVKKVLAWRLLSTVVGIAITYAYLGEVRSAGELTIIFTVVMTTLHYFFEGWWSSFESPSQDEDL